MTNSRVENRLAVDRAEKCWTAYYDGDIFLRWYDMALARQTLSEICGRGWIVSYL